MVIVKNKIILLPGNKNKVILIIKYQYLQQEKSFQFSKFKYIFIKQWVLHWGGDHVTHSISSLSHFAEKEDVYKRQVLC